LKAGGRKGKGGRRKGQEEEEPEEEEEEETEGKPEVNEATEQLFGDVARWTSGLLKVPGGLGGGKKRRRL